MVLALLPFETPRDMATKILIFVVVCISRLRSSVSAQQYSSLPASIVYASRLSLEISDLGQIVDSYLRMILDL